MGICVGAVAVIDLLSQRFGDLQTEDEHHDTTAEDGRRRSVVHRHQTQACDHRQHDDAQDATDREAKETLPTAPPFGGKRPTGRHAEPRAGPIAFVTELTAQQRDRSQVLQGDRET